MFQINKSGPDMNPGEIPNPPEDNKKVHFLYTCTQTFNTVTLYTCTLVLTGQYS